MQLPLPFPRLFSLLIGASLLAPASSPAADWELADGDRVVFLGDGLIEQAQYFGWVELMMTTSFPDRDVSFRNLGWNADTPAGDSRFGLSLLQAGREPADEGWNQLQKQLELTRPTVLVLGYGMASSLEEGDRGLEHFVEHYRRLIDASRKISPSVRFLFLSPLQRLDGDDPHQAVLDRYSEAIRRLAEQADSPFVDLGGVALDPKLRKDPIHVNGDGYREIASAIESALGWQPLDWRNNPQAEQLREVILRKNEWWFHRSRPANMAYVFGFRKHEQGQNASEIPKFDGLIAEEERRIARLRSLRPIPLEAPQPRTESRYAKFTEQPTPEFTLGEDLEVTLWAENPQLNKPIQINFDPQGRLWVASSEAYPMIEVGQAAPDKILVLEDTDDDGRADQSTVFADGLLIPTGVEPGDGGVYVAQSTDLLHLRDTDGDGKADSRRRVLSGFGTEDTHHNLHTLRWGPDGRLYMNQSVYTRTNTETPHGVVRLKAGGGFRYNTRSMRMQVFFRGLWNSWGHDFDDFGQSFLSDGAGFDGIAYAFPGAVFNPTPGAKRQLELISPGNYPKFCSLEIIGGDAFPPEWQGSLITCDFRANRVTRFSLHEQDAGFVTRQEADLMRTSASTFRPIDVKQGPDGALYIADWSNPIINHGEVDFRDERRDRWHGRIWRLSWKGAKPRKRVDLRDAKTGRLLDHLLSDDRYTRQQSRRVLLERGDVGSDLKAWIARQSTDSAKLQGMWLAQGLGLRDALPLELLEAKDGRVRAAAVRVVSDFADPATDQPRPFSWDEAKRMFSPRVVDEHPRVRLEAIAALANFETAEAATLALAALEKPVDRFIEFALAETIDRSAEPLMDEIESGRWTVDAEERADQLAFVLTSVDPRRASEFLAKRLSDRPLPRDGSGPWIDLIASAGGREQLRVLYEQIASGGCTPDATARGLQSLARAARLRKLRPAGPAKGMGTLLGSDTQRVQQAAIELAGAWKLGGQVSRLAEIAANVQLSEASRLAALDALRDIGTPAAADELKELADRQHTDTVRRRAVVALAGIDLGRAAEPFFSLLEDFSSEPPAVELWRDILRVRRAGPALAKRLPSEGISEIAARAGVRACRDGGRDEPELLAALLPLSGLTLTADQLTPERIRELVSRVQSEGDPHRGEAIYLREELACVSCHAIGGVGGKVGPDMTSLGASAPLDYLIESLLDPNAKIKEGYHSVTVLTEDGLVVTGIETESTDSELVLRNAEDDLVRIPQANVAAKKPAQSLMPTGVVDRLPIEEQLHLVAFLSQLGKPGEFDASRGGVARGYEVFAGTHRVEQQGAERIIDGELETGWKPLVTRVNGEVARETLQRMTAQPRNIALVHVYLRTEIEVGGEGPVSLSVEGPTQAAVWIDGEPVEGETTFKTELAAGRHVVLVRLDARDLPPTFRLTSPDASFVTSPRD